MRPTTKSLITIICGFYLAALLIPGLQEQIFLIDRAILSDGLIHGVATGEYWRVLTVALTHGGIAHLFFNMYALLLLGNTLEEVIVRKKFLALFIISQIGASLASLYANPENQPSVGASGAIFGLFGAMAVLTRKYGFRDKSIYAIIGINFAIGFVLPGIDWQAHLGGFITGSFASFFLLAPTRR
jgi:membrane associated rhomboid family serine protease